MEYNNISDDFSVVVQGKIFGAPGDSYEKQQTLQSIESIRKFLPGAEIIISTWEGSDVSHLPYDKVVFNHDPGAVAISIHDPNFLNNNNRQIVSTYNGLKAATRKYAIKMRGDCKLISTAFIDFLLKEYPRSDKFRFFKQRVLIPTKYSRNPRRIAQLNHPSDIFQVGLLEDLLNLWNISLQPEPETTRAIPLEKRIINNSLNGPYFRMKSGPEQYNWYAFARKNGLDLELKYFSNLPVSKIMSSEMSIMNNFLIADGEELGVQLPKRMTDHYDRDLYTHEEWLRISSRYAKGVNKLDEAWLIAQVYASNIKMIAIRALRSLNYRCKAFLKKILNAGSRRIELQS